MTTRVLVAGAGGGIGSACVSLLRDRGYAVVGVDREPSDGLAGHDVTLPGGAEDAVAHALDELTELDGVVHAVGMSGRRLGDGRPSACTDEAWGEVMRVNLESAFRLVRAAMPRIGAGGSIVLIGSVLGTSTDDDFLTAAYATSKAGLVGLARSVAREGAARGIRANVVAAGLTATPMGERALDDDTVRARLSALQPLGARAVEPREVAGAVAWLLSDDAPATTGTTIHVDRGWTLR